LAVDGDGGLGEIDVFPDEAERLGDPQAAADQQFRQWAVCGRAARQVQIDLVDAQVVALEMSERKALDACGGVGLQQPVVGRLVEADDEHAERVVERLGFVDAGRGGFGEPLAHVGGRDLIEAPVTELGDQALGAMCAVVVPSPWVDECLWPVSQDSK
jgi:hypothetical protein